LNVTVPDGYGGLLGEAELGAETTVFGLALHTSTEIDGVESYTFQRLEHENMHSNSNTIQTLSDRVGDGGDGGVVVVGGIVFGARNLARALQAWARPAHEPSKGWPSPPITVRAGPVPGQPTVLTMSIFIVIYIMFLSFIIYLF
jgi:hypothetical protein